MTTETEFLEEIAEIILSAVENNQYGLTKDVICTEGHFSPQMLNRERLLNMKSYTFMRFLLYIGSSLPTKILEGIISQLHHYIASVAEMEDGSIESIFSNHEGSPVNVSKKLL